MIIRSRKISMGFPLTLVAIFSLSIAVMYAEAAGSLPRIKILATGGTIAGAQAEGQDAGTKLVVLRSKT